MKIGFFDFDGTITEKDSFLEFLKFSHSIFDLIKGGLCLAPTLMGYAIGMIPNGSAKQKVFSWFFKGWEEKRFLEMASNFSRVQIPKLAKKSALERISWHKSQGHKVVIISASIETYLKDWCESLELDLHCTGVEFNGGLVTGNFSTPNCYGLEKVNRIRANYDLKAFDYIYAYGDSNGDKEMLALANEKFYCFFT